MNSKKLFFLFFLLIAYLTGAAQQQNELNSIEVKCINLFNDFTGYIKKGMESDSKIYDSSSLKNILLNYLYINRNLDSSQTNRLDSNILSEEELKFLRRELEDFFRYFIERNESYLIDNIAITPLRLSTDKFIYDHMTKFQKENTYILYDKRKPNEILSYLLFIPAIKGVINEPRIWSWLLGFRFGKFYFTSAIGEKGYEHLFP